MEERVCKMADIPVAIRAQDPYVTRMCRKFEICGERPRFHFSATPEEVERERTQELSSYGVLESLAIYRKLCETFLELDTFLFHGSAVAVDGRAYLFAAPSGTGKSTHTRLWRERFGERAVMINDDKPLLQLRSEAVYACGTPWNGKHRLSTPGKAPLAGICLLERGTVNKAWRITPAEAYPGLYRQTYRPADREKLIKTLDLLRELAERVPVYRLQCDISQEAVTASWEAMCGASGSVT